MRSSLPRAFCQAGASRDRRQLACSRLEAREPIDPSGFVGFAGLRVARSTAVAPGWRGNGALGTTALIGCPASGRASRSHDRRERLGDPPIVS